MSPEGRNTRKGVGNLRINMKDNNKIKIQCDRCGQFETDGKWDGIKREIIRTGKVSHGPCPECLKKVLAIIEAM